MQAANAPPPTWISTRAGAGSASRISQPMVRPPSRHRPFSGPCTLNGIAPPATDSRNRSTAGSPASASRRGHLLMCADSESRVSMTAPPSMFGTYTWIGQPAVFASVDAAMAALPHDAMASGRRASFDARPSSSAARRCSRIVTR